MECLECVECGPIEGQGEFCRRGDLHGSKGLYYSYLLRDFQTHPMTSFRDKAEKPLFGAQKTQNLGPKIFFEKSGFVSILTFLSPNLMQKIGTIQ